MAPFGLTPCQVLYIYYLISPPDKSSEECGVNLMLKMEIFEAYKGLGSLLKVTASM